MSIRLVVLAAVSSLALFGEERGALVNPGALHREIRVEPGAAGAVQAFLPSFREYQNLVLYHPKFGYYSSGKVDFVNDFKTFPDALYPYFGQMMAEQIYRMWDGMRKAGTLGERFTVAEFGGGDGALAESILEHVERQAGSERERWRQFSQQLIYAAYDRSPALSARQRARNAKFGARFEAREGDAIHPTVPQGTLTGVVLSNELPDTFGVHKVLFSLDGSAETAFVAASLSKEGLGLIEGELPEKVRQRLVEEDAAIRKQILPSEPGGALFLSGEGLKAVLEGVFAGATGAGDMSKLEAIQFHEVYVPAGTVPELAAHIRRYAQEYAVQVARGGGGLVAYVNLDEGKFLREAGAMLKAGYVLTVDYGGNWNKVAEVDIEHLRVFGPEPGDVPPSPDLGAEIGPYFWPTYYDLTTDVNFSHMADEAKESKLEPVFFGPQSNLLLGTGLRLEEVPESKDATFFEWTLNFFNWQAYKMLIERKAGTDPAYVFPRGEAEPLEVDLKTLTAQQQALARKVAVALGRIQ